MYILDFFFGNVFLQQNLHWRCRSTTRRKPVLICWKLLASKLGHLNLLSKRFHICTLKIQSLICIDMQVYNWFFTKCMNSCSFFILATLEWITVTSLPGMSPAAAAQTWIWKAKLLLCPLQKIFALYWNLNLHWPLQPHMSFVSWSLCFLIIMT